MTTIWEEVKIHMKGELSEKSFSMWINPISLLEDKGDRLVLGCPNKFSLKWVMENYREIIEEKLNKLGSGELKLSLKVQTPEKRPQVPDLFRTTKQLTLPRVSRPSSSVKKWLNTEYTFDRFVVGKCNNFAYSASKALASDATWPYPHLFLLAKTGLGKSHLSHAIGNTILEHNPGIQVCYVTVEEFMNQMVFAIKHNKIDEFKNKYRRCCDVLLLEEVHFLSGKEKTQQELGYTLDALANDQKKIIFTSSLLPKDIPGLTSELASRLTSGIITTLEKPDYDTRVRILEKKASEQNLVLSEEIIQLLANHLTRDVRQMESVLRCLKAKSELLKAKNDADLAKEEIDRHVSEQGAITMENIEHLVCKYFKVDRLLLRSKSRRKVYTYPRGIYVYLCRQLTGTTVEEIGRSINRKHSTVLYAAEVIEHKMKIDGRVRNQVNFLKEKLEQKTT